MCEVGTDRGLVGVDWHVVHLVEVVVQQALLGVGLDDLAQGLPAQLLWGQSRGKAVHALGRPAGWTGERSWITVTFDYLQIYPPNVWEHYTH